MAMEYFQVKLPKTFLPFINHASGNNIDAKVKTSLAIGMFIEKQVSLARAAELAEQPLADFIDLLKSKNIPWMEYTEEHLDDDCQVIQEVLSKDDSE